MVWAKYSLFKALDLLGKKNTALLLLLFTDSKHNMPSRLKRYDTSHLI